MLALRLIQRFRPNMKHLIPVSMKYSTHSEGSTEGSIQGDPSSDFESVKSHETLMGLLNTSLKYVPEYGFTNEAIEHAAEERGLSVSIRGLLEQPIDNSLCISHIEAPTRLALFLSQQATLHMIRHVRARPDFENLRVHQKVRAACVSRLRFMSPYIHRWPEALALFAKPPYVPLAFRELATFADEAWYLAGDKSTDMNWYSKRVLLTGVYTSSELFMTQDHSYEFEATYEFLDRRLEDTRQLGEFTSATLKWAQFATDSAAAAIARFQTQAK